MATPDDTLKALKEALRLSQWIGNALMQARVTR